MIKVRIEKNGITDHNLTFTLTFTLRNESFVLTHFKSLLAETSFCWAFAISSMIRHSLNYYLGQLAKEQPLRFDRNILVMAIQHLNSTDFHKKLRRSFSIFLNEFSPISTIKNLNRNELIMIPIPKSSFHIGDFESSKFLSLIEIGPPSLAQSNDLKFFNVKRALSQNFLNAKPLLANQKTTTLMK